MEIKRVVTIARSGVLETLERKLGAIHLHGVTISKVKGFGKRSTFFANDRTIPHSKIEILPMSRMSTPSSGRSRQFAHGRDRQRNRRTVPVDTFFRIRTASEAMPYPARRTC